VRVRYVASPDELGQSNAVILPETKSTVEDLVWLFRNGLDRAIARVVGRRR